MSTVPQYRHLPVLDKLGLPHAWDVWGREDNLGTLNHLTRDRVVAAAAEIVTGERFALSLPSDLVDPPLFGRRPLHRDVFATSRNEWDEKYDSMYPQASLQGDGLLHVRAREHGFWTGYTGDLRTPAAGSASSTGHTESPDAACSSTSTRCSAPAARGTRSRRHPSPPRTWRPRPARKI